MSSSGKMEYSSRLKPKIKNGISKYYPYYSSDCTTDSFPRKCFNKHKLDLPGQDKNYSCSLEMVKLVRAYFDLLPLPDSEISKLIKLRPNVGADQVDLLNGLKSMGINCRGSANNSSRNLKKILTANKNICIFSGQQPYGQKYEIENGEAGHYFAGCCGDEKYAYFADPGFPNGKIRIKWEYIDYIWHDIELATGNILYGYLILIEGLN